MPAALYWLVLSLVTFLGIRAAIEIEATRTRLSLVVLVVGVAFSAAYFLERLLRNYVDVALNGQPGEVQLKDVIAGSLPEWLCRNKEHPRAKYRGTEEPRAVGSLWVWEIPD
jgi:hypothetical protein